MLILAAVAISKTTKLSIPINLQKNTPTWAKSDEKEVRVRVCTRWSECM